MVNKFFPLLLLISFSSFPLLNAVNNNSTLIAQEESNPAVAEDLPYSQEQMGQIIREVYDSAFIFYTADIEKRAEILYLFHDSLEHNYNPAQKIKSLYTQVLMSEAMEKVMQQIDELSHHFKDKAAFWNDVDKIVHRDIPQNSKIDQYIKFKKTISMAPPLMNGK